MFNSTVLDVVIGLVFIYLLYSLFATIIQEIFATYRNLRAKILKKGIARMLDDDSKEYSLFATINQEILATYRNLRAKILKKGIARMLDDDCKEICLSEEFYKHPLIKYLGENKRYGKPGKPAYLTAQNFSKVLIDLLRGDNFQPGQSQNPLIQQALNDGKILWKDRINISPETLSYIKSIWADAQGDVEKFRVLLEQWFDDTMERASGWYKKQTQVILFFIGLSIAIFFNVDSISIAKKLSNNPKLASQLANNASVYLQNHEEIGINPSDSGEIIPKDKITESIALIDSANSLVQKNIKDANKLLGLGWTKVCKNGESKFSFWPNFYWHSIFGWVITALAISLGAPFWFDLLNKLMKLRSSVASSTPDEKQKKQAEQTPTVKRVG